MVQPSDEFQEALAIAIAKGRTEFEVASMLIDVEQQGN
jgi:hypothetical protein